MKIKYSFHELSVKDPKEYRRRKYKLLGNKPRHKVWVVKNCSICGRFCSKWSEKYCKDCGRTLRRLRGHFD